MTQKLKTFTEKRKIIEMIKNFPKLKIKTYAGLLNMSEEAVYTAMWRLAKRKIIFFKGKYLSQGRIYVINKSKKTNL